MDREQGNVMHETEGVGKTSRRTLLKGAVVAGVGVAAYSAPIVSTVPAYAGAGLSSFSDESGDICIGFSPEHSNKIGDWHIPATVANIFDAGAFSNTEVPSTSTATVKIMVPPGAGGTLRPLELSGNYNNWDGTTSGNYTVDGWNGGGIRMNLLDPNCEMLIVGWYASQNGDVTNCTMSVSPVNTMHSSNAPITSGGVNPGVDPGFQVPNPWTGGPVYFHSGKPRKGTGYVAGIRFRIRCK